MVNNSIWCFLRSSAIVSMLLLCYDKLQPLLEQLTSSVMGLKDSTGDTLSTIQINFTRIATILTLIAVSFFVIWLITEAVKATMNFIKYIVDNWKNKERIRYMSYGHNNPITINNHLDRGQGSPAYRPEYRSNCNSGTDSCLDKSTMNIKPDTYQYRQDDTGVRREY